MFFVATIAAGTSLAFTETGDAAPESDLSWHPATILSRSDHATVSWQVRSAGNVRLRLYREQAAGGEALVNEVITQRGTSSFEFVDEKRPPGNSVYVLRVLGLDGNETTLGSAFCIESRFAPSDVSSTDGSTQLAYTREKMELQQPRSIGAIAQLSLLDDGFIPGPDPPVPRMTGHG